MPFPKRDDPTDPDDPDEQAMMTSLIPKPLLWGLVKGVIMLAVVAGLTWVVAIALRDRAQDEGQSAKARDQTVAQPVDTVPPSTGSSPDGRPADTATTPAPTPPAR